MNAIFAPVSAIARGAIGSSYMVMIIGIGIFFGLSDAFRISTIGLYAYL